MALAALGIPLLIAALSFGAKSAAGQDTACADPGHATDHIVVKMRDGVSEVAVERMKAVNGEGGENYLILSEVWLVDLPAGLTVPEAVELYGSEPDVQYAEPDGSVYLEDPCPPEAPSLHRSLSDSADPVRTGEELVYATIVRNEGTAAATDVEVFSGLSDPENASFVRAGFVGGPPGGDCPPDGSLKVRCRLGNLAPGGSATFELVVRPTRPGVLNNVVEVGSSNAGGYGFEISEATQVVADPRGCTISGTRGADRLVGTTGHDVICGNRGDDTLVGGEGDDLIYGGYGRDNLSGGPGRDLLLGHYGNDTLRARDGVHGNDETRGGPGRDVIFTDPGDRVAEQGSSDQADRHRAREPGGVSAATPQPDARTTVTEGGELY